MKILVAPDKFKDALDARQAAEALACGAADARPDAEIDVCPVGDGGEGTGLILARGLGADEKQARVADPLGREREARWWLTPDGQRAVIEMAEASGLHLLAERERDPLHTTSFGTGQLLRAALEEQPREILLCVGGSATVDGGAGCLQALGWRLLDSDGNRIVQPITGAQLGGIARVRPPAWSPSVNLTILTDVDSPLLGRDGAARAFGPQKGASPAAVEQLEANLRHWARVLIPVRGHLVHAMHGGGAAGGLPAGLEAALGARVEPGFKLVAEQLGLADRLRGCALCLTGEGRLDAQTAHGKVVAGVAQLASVADVPTVAFVGAAQPPADYTLQQFAQELGLASVVVVTPPGTPLAVALREAGPNLRAAVAAHLRRAVEP